MKHSNSFSKFYCINSSISTPRVAFYNLQDCSTSKSFKRLGLIAFFSSLSLVKGMPYFILSISSCTSSGREIRSLLVEAIQIIGLICINLSPNSIIPNIRDNYKKNSQKRLFPNFSPLARNKSLKRTYVDKK